MKGPAASRLMTDMTWQEFQQAMPESVVCICVGSVEQHGPHMPLSVDLDIPYGLATVLSAALSHKSGSGAASDVQAEVASGSRHTISMIVAPPVYYAGPSNPATGGGEHFPGTTSLKGHTLTLLIRDVLSDFARQGCRKFLIMNGHFENTAFISEAAREIAPATGAKIVIANWWELVAESVLADLFPGGFPGWEVEHASLTETSLMMHFRPESVKTDRIPHQVGKKHQPRPHVFPEPAGMVPATGILFSADGASANAGAALAQHLILKLAEIVREEFSS